MGTLTAQWPGATLKHSARLPATLDDNAAMTTSVPQPTEGDRTRFSVHWELRSTLSLPETVFVEALNRDGLRHIRGETLALGRDRQLDRLSLARSVQPAPCPWRDNHRAS